MSLPYIDINVGFLRTQAWMKSLFVHGLLSPSGGGNHRNWASSIWVASFMKDLGFDLCLCPWFLGGSRQPLRIKAKEFANVEQSLGRACHPSFKVFSNRILRNNPTCLQFLIVKKMSTYAREKVPFATVVRCWKHVQCESIINGNNQVLNCLQSLVVYQGSLLHTYLKFSNTITLTGFPQDHVGYIH